MSQANDMHAWIQEQRELYDRTAPDGSKVVEAILAAVSAQFELSERRDRDFSASFKIGPTTWFAVEVSPEKKAVSSATWEQGAFNWNGRWKVVLREGMPKDRSKTWRPSSHTLDSLLPEVVATVRSWLEPKAAGPTLVKKPGT